MRKFEIDYIKQEVNSKSRCISGVITTKFNDKRDTLEEERGAIFKEYMIEGKVEVDTAKLYEIFPYQGMNSGLKPLVRESITLESDRYDEITNELKNLKERKEELLDTITLRAKTIISDAVLGLTPKEKIMESIESLKELDIF